MSLRCCHIFFQIHVPPVVTLLVHLALLERQVQQARLELRALQGTQENQVCQAWALLGKLAALDHRVG